MITVDEAHSVEIFIGNEKYEFGPYLLNEDDVDLDMIRNEILKETQRPEVSDVFDKTFLECEKYPGNVSREISAENIKIIVTRYIH